MCCVPGGESSGCWLWSCSLSPCAIYPSTRESYGNTGEYGQRPGTRLFWRIAGWGGNLFIAFYIHSRFLCRSPNYKGASDFNALFTPLTFLVSYFNSGVNPILYAFLSRNFRKGMRELLFCSMKKAWTHSSTKQRPPTQVSGLRRNQIVQIWIGWFIWEEFWVGNLSVSANVFSEFANEFHNSILELCSACHALWYVFWGCNCINLIQNLHLTRST